jgi:hypothetical protein
MSTCEYCKQPITEGGECPACGKRLDTLSCYPYLSGLGSVPRDCGFINLILCERAIIEEKPMPSLSDTGDALEVLVKVVRYNARVNAGIPITGQFRKEISDDNSMYPVRGDRCGDKHYFVVNKIKNLSKLIIKKKKFGYYPTLIFYWANGNNFSLPT